MKNIAYLSKPVVGSEEMERYAIGPIPPISFQVDKYVSIMEATELLKTGLGPAQELRPHPKDKSVMVLGTWCVDTFMPVLLVNEEQLIDIGENTSDMEDWEKKDYVCIPYDIQYKKEKN